MENSAAACMFQVDIL